MNTFRVSFVAIILFLGASCHSLLFHRPQPVATSIVSTEAINPYGTVQLAHPNSLLSDSDIHSGDLVRVSFPTHSIDVPVLPSYRLVGPGEDVLVNSTQTNTPILLATFYGSFAERHGLASRPPDRSSTQPWLPAPSIQYPLPVTITLLKHNAYVSNLSLLSIVRTTNRSDYAALSDSEFANFRSVRAPSLRPNVLYRSSSPIQPKLGRNHYADTACRNAGIHSIVNMSDSKTKALQTPGFTNTYVSSQATLFLPMGVDFFAPSFQTNLATCIRFLSTNTPPALLHCIEGQDRTGFACALIAAYFGAPYHDLEADYLTTFQNYYGATLSPKSESALKATFSRLLSRSLSLPEPLPETLQGPARSYFLSIGLTPTDLAALETTFQTPPPATNTK